MTLPFWLFVVMSILAIPGVLMTIFWLWVICKLMGIYWKEGMF